MQPLPWPEPDPQVAAAVKAIYRRRDFPLSVQVRDMLGEVFPDEGFAEVFGVRGRPGWSPGRLALVCVLQKAENLTDRQAAEMAARDLAWKYALGLALDDPGFDFSVLSEFRARVVAGGMEQHVLDALLAALVKKGLVAAGGKQRTDSTHVVAAVRDLNRLELAGEAVRAAAEAIVAAVPDWFAAHFDVLGWSKRYGRRIDDWRLPTSKIGQAELATDFGTDGFALIDAVYSVSAPPWLRELPGVQVLRAVLLQNYRCDVDEAGKQVIKRRDADTDGIPPAPSRIASPYDLDARWAARDDWFWLGYKVHLTETCEVPPPQDKTAARGLDGPNIITNVLTTDATVPDAVAAPIVHTMLAGRGLTPAEHYIDSGYPSASLLVTAKAEHGIDLVTPLLTDHSRQAKAAAGYDRASFDIDFDKQRATCPNGKTSASWNPVVRAGADAIVVTFARTDCRPCPSRTDCTRSATGRRQLMVPPKQVHEAQRSARLQQQTTNWQARYALRAGVEGTINQAVHVTGIRRARYRGIDKTRLDHVLCATALNLIRLDAYWNGHLLDRTRTSHLAHLELKLAA